MEKMIDGKVCVLTYSLDPCSECCFNGVEACETKDRECMTEENEYMCWKLKKKKRNEKTE